MKVFKFGGASVKDAEAVRNVAEIVKRYQDDDVAMVVSAMGKTTNALERLHNTWFNQQGDAFEVMEEVRAFHHNIMDQLFDSRKHPVYDDVNNLFVEIEWAIEDPPQRDYDYEYDQIVSVGELLSTRIVSAYLGHIGLPSKWVDARDFVKTDNTHRDARIDWEASQAAADRFLKPIFSGDDNALMVTQGFIGVTTENFTTTLGREGSDFTGAILSWVLSAESLTIWKDVPGMLNADPKWFDDTRLLANISYREAIELAYCGASVIHPKTIKPLENRSVPLYVRSFVNPDAPGTIIDTNTDADSLIPSFIFAVDQILLSIAATDFSFIVEDSLSEIFGILAERNIKVKLMQNSAISFSVCIANDPRKMPELLDVLKQRFNVKYNEGVEMVTIRHYDQATIDRVSIGKEILLEQRTRHTIRLVMRDVD